MNLLKCNFLFLVFFCLSATSVFASNYTGKVVGVIDGDTIEVLHNQHPERIRLSGIDCPEKGQAYGKRARQATSELVFGKDVTLETHGHDKYRRTIGDVILPDGMNLNQELVKQGSVLVVSEICAGEHSAGAAREGCDERGRKDCGPIRNRCRRGSGGREDSVTRVRSTFNLRESRQRSTSSFAIAIHSSATSGT